MKLSSYPIHRLVILMLMLPFLGYAQSNRGLIDSIQQLMLKRYVYLDKAQEVNTHLDRLWEADYFETFTKPEELANELTKQMREITKDYHLSVRSTSRIAPQKTTEPADPLQRLARYSPSMINGYQYFEHNVGYFDMRYFGSGLANWGQLDEVMQKLSKADAMIIDLRYSLGGSMTTVQYLCSYFFDQDMLLSSIYSRHDDHTAEFRTVAVNGQKRPRVPVFILTSDRSFSAAEDFPYTMQSHGRAVIVGEITRGGAHPVRSHNLVRGFRAQIPFARSINPVTKSNWEGVGVIPNVEVSEDLALEKAKALATEEAKKYKESSFAPLLKALDAPTHEIVSLDHEQTIQQHLKQLVANNMLNENDINRLGYNYFLTGKKEAALVIFKANTQFYSNSANVFDSYAEILAELGHTEEALKNFRKAVAVAKAQNHSDLDVFQQNLAAFEQKDR